jgi:hypothetical protein
MMTDKDKLTLADIHSEIARQIKKTERMGAMLPILGLLSEFAGTDGERRAVKSLSSLAEEYLVCGGLIRILSAMLVAEGKLSADTLADKTHSTPEQILHFSTLVEPPETAPTIR